MCEKNQPHNPNPVQFRKFALLQYTLKELTAYGEFECQVVFGTGFEPFVKFYLVCDGMVSVWNGTIG